MKRKNFLKRTCFMCFGVIALLMSSCDDSDDGPDMNQQAFDAADVVNGGRMYDKFWADETNFTDPADPSVNLATITDYGDFYRCKGCHGWDQLGNSASYIDRGPKTSRPSVASNNVHQFVATNSISDIFDAVKNVGGRDVDASLTSDGTNGQGDGHPDFSKILSDEQIWDLVKFLKAGAFDVTQLYTIQTSGTYSSGSRSFTHVGEGGDVSAGVTFYSDNCSSCHGANGRDNGNGINIQINQDIGRSIGEFVREKPYELQHKAVYGNLGSSPDMLGVNSANIDDIKNMFLALSDTTAYPDL
jgi:mono/diheme cytochrome c family protein